MNWCHLIDFQPQPSTPSSPSKSRDDLESSGKSDVTSYSSAYCASDDDVLTSHGRTTRKQLHSSDTEPASLEKISAQARAAEKITERHEHRIYRVTQNERHTEEFVDDVPHEHNAKHNKVDTTHNSVRASFEVGDAKRSSDSENDERKTTKCRKKKRQKVFRGIKGKDVAEQMWCPTPQPTLKELQEGIKKQWPE